MGPAKGSRTISKITIKGFDDRHHNKDSTSSSKVKLKKRKMLDLGPEWSKDELMRFYEAYRRHGKNWKTVSAAVGGKSADMVEALYSVHRTFLSLPERDGTAVGFITLVTGHHNVLNESPRHKESDQKVKASGKARRRGDAVEQKENAAPHPQHDYQDMVVCGFSLAFKKRYFGELVRYIKRNPVGKRTPRVPVIVPSVINATDNCTPQIKNPFKSTKKANGEINNGGTGFEMNDCSPDGSSGITETNKVVQGQTFLEIKGSGGTDICDTQQYLKKRRIEQSIDEDEMMVLDVLESLVTVPSKMPDPKTNIPSGTLGTNISASSHIRNEEPSPVDQSKQRNQDGECSASKTRKKRRKKLLDEEVPDEEQSNSGNASVLPEAPHVDITKQPSLDSDFERGAVDLPVSTANNSAEVSFDAPRKIDPEINMSRKSKWKYKMQSRTKYASCNEGAANIQARKMMHCLSSESLRRWCTYEWFYSAVDYPWFMNNEFVNYLKFAKLSHLSRLTRSEWSTIRSSLGKPRRFSGHFLAVEKEKLEDYRGNVRKYYAELSDDLRDSLPADLAQPFSTGQRVIVRHPNSRELCDGKVVMMERDSYKVQFDRPDLGVALVKDTDCMPVNWLDNLPDDLKRRRSLSNNAGCKLDIEHILELTPKQSLGHIIPGVPVSEPSRSPLIESDERLKAESAVGSEMLPSKSTICRYAPPPFQSVHSLDDTLQCRGRPSNSSGHSDELDSYITVFVQNSRSQAKQMVAEAIQAISENGNEERTCISNQATHCSLESEAFLHDAQLPSNLILNCVATVLAIKDLSECRHPPANIAGVLERAFSMLHPSCSENLTIYNDIGSCISVIKNQILGLVPTTSGNGSSAMLM